MTGLSQMYVRLSKTGDRKESPPQHRSFNAPIFAPISQAVRHDHGIPFLSQMNEIPRPPSNESRVRHAQLDQGQRQDTSRLSFCQGERMKG